MAVKVSDKKLVCDFRKGSIDAFEELVRRYSVRVFSMAWRFTRNQEDAEETVQDVFATVFRKLHSFQNKCALSSWIYRITVNASLMTLRKKRRDKSTAAIEDLQDESQETVLLRTTVEQESESLLQSRRIGLQIEDAILRLPDDYRVVYVMRDVDGLPASEVASALQISVPAVKSRLHRARLTVRKRLLPVYRELQGKKESSQETVCSAAG